MSFLFRGLLGKFFPRRIERSAAMECADDTLYYSHQKLSNLIQEKGDPKAAIKDYLQNLNYQPVKDFAAGLEWFNVSEPLSFVKHLKGKIVVLDFFTYCCINCMHIIPDLREIEQEFSVEDGLVVIGVHSAKFENEKISSNILAAVQRYNITHPVVNDHKSDMWRNCDVHCWPTLLILGPSANPIVMLMGEGHKKNLRIYIRSALEFYKAKKQISDHKLPFESAYHLLPDLKGPLLFPGKITSVVDAENQEMLAVSDTGNHRVLVLKPDGAILHQIGGGGAGQKDGAFESCRFNAPQGLAFRDAATLYVADTENHVIRKVDLTTRTVETVAGTGIQGDDKIGGKLWTQQPISSPWDLCMYRTPDMDMTFYPDGNPPLRDVLVVAMAGTHQIWALFLEETVWWKCKKYPAGTFLCIAGSGREENRNNAYPLSAGFAQPSGLALCGGNKEVYVADSESSSVRRLSLVDGKVTAVVGGDRNPQNLFAFGDKDGTLFDAKLQHLLGLAISRDERTLFVADTYNHKLKKVDVAQNRVATLPPPTSDAAGGVFNEPAGLCVSANGNQLYVADTNNHAIKVLDLNPDCTVRSLTRLDLTVPQAKTDDRRKLQVCKSDKLVVLNVKGGKLILGVAVKFENGLELTEEAPQRWRVALPGATWSCVPSSGGDLRNIDVVVSAPGGKSGDVDFVFSLVTCTEDTCLPKSFVVRVPVSFKDEGRTGVTSDVVVILGPNQVRVD